MQSGFKWLRRLMAAAAGVVLLAVSAGAQAAIDTKDPYKMVAAVAEHAFNELRANQDKIKDNGFRRQLIRQELMPYIDTAYAAYRVIGNSLKQTSAEERKDFIAAFADYIELSFAEVLGQYTDQELVSPAYQTVDDKVNQVNAKFLIRQSGKQDYVVILKLRKNNKTGEWKVFDLEAENISLLSAKQSELGPLIRDKGLAAVTRQIRDQVANNQVAPVFNTEAQ